MYVHYTMQRIMQNVQYDRKQIEPDRIDIILNYVHKVTFYITSYSMNATETVLLHFYLISMFVRYGQCHVYIKEVSLS